MKATINLLLVLFNLQHYSSEIRNRALKWWLWNVSNKYDEGDFASWEIKLILIII